MVQSLMCANCIAELDDGRISIRTSRKISPGEELSIDYALVGDDKPSKQ